MTTAGPDGPRIARRVERMSPGRLFRLLNEGHKHDAVDMALGVPEAPPTPPALVEEACAALRSGGNQYEIPDGNLELRTAIAESLAAPTDPGTMLTITVGATEGLFVSVLATVDPGDEVVILEPFYENFVSAVALAGGTPRLVRMRPPGWRFDPDELAAAFGPRTSAIILSTPNNPTGHVLTAAEIDTIAALCDRWNAVAIVDEIYSGFTFDGHRHRSPGDHPALRDRSLVIGSMSKTQAVSGWRVGYLRASPALTEVARRIHVVACGGTAAPLQRAVARAAAADPAFSTPSDGLARQRELTVAAFAEIGVRCIPPDGGCYTIGDIRPATREDSEAFAFRLIEEAGVMVAPGGYFHHDARLGAGFVRISFNRRIDTLLDVQRRLAGLRHGRDVEQRV